MLNRLARRTSHAFRRSLSPLRDHASGTPLARAVRVLTLVLGLMIAALVPAVRVSALTVTGGQLGLVAAPGATQVQITSPSPIPAGWGVMSPGVVLYGADQYAPLWYRCPGQTTRYCLQIIRNGSGTAYSTALDLAAAPQPAGHVATGAYQPPLLFVRGDRLVVVYWEAATVSGAARSVIVVQTLQLGQTAPQSWTHRQSYSVAGCTSFNYLGGAMRQSSGEIFVSGWGRCGGAERLDVLKFAPGATNTYATAPTSNTVWSTASSAFAPTYSHVSVRTNGSLSILTTLTQTTDCTPVGGSPYRHAYKNVVNFEGPWNGPYGATWSDATVDAADPNNSATNGSPCTGTDRFPLAQMYVASEDAVYSIVRAAEPLPGDATKLGPYYFKLYRNNQVIVPNLASAFSAGASGVTASDLTYISMTRLANGTFVFVGSGLAGACSASQKRVALATTSNPVSTAPSFSLSIDTPYFVGNSVLVAQPDKNGMTQAGITQLNMAHSGSEFPCPPKSPTNQPLNNQHWHRYYRYTVTP